MSICSKSGPPNKDVIADHHRVSPLNRFVSMSHLKRFGNILHRLFINLYGTGRVRLSPPYLSPKILCKNSLSDGLT